MNILRLFLCFSLIGLCGSLAAQQQPQPRLSLSERSIDRGSVPLSDTVQTFVFHYKNTGDSPLIVSQMAPSCTCVVPEFSSEPLAPGDSTTFTVRFTPPHAGRFSQLITIFSNGVQSIHRVYIRGNVTEVENKE